MQKEQSTQDQSISPHIGLILIFSMSIMTTIISWMFLDGALNLAGPIDENLFKFLGYGLFNFVALLAVPLLLFRHPDES